MATYPCVSVSATTTDPYRPNERVVRFKVEVPGEWLVRAWFTDGAEPTAVPAVGAPLLEFVTEPDGTHTETVTATGRVGWFCQAAVTGALNTYGGGGSMTPPDSLMVGPASAPVADDAAFLAWIATPDVVTKAHPVAGDSITYDLVPPVTSLVIAIPEDLDPLVTAKFVQTITGADIMPAFGDAISLTFKGVTYAVYQFTPYLPWSNPDTYTLTLSP